jgi:hypothetical protein
MQLALDLIKHQSRKTCVGVEVQLHSPEKEPQYSLENPRVALDAVVKK